LRDLKSRLQALLKNTVGENDIVLKQNRKLRLYVEFKTVAHSVGAGLPHAFFARYKIAPTSIAEKYRWRKRYCLKAKSEARLYVRFETVSHSVGAGLPRAFLRDIKSRLQASLKSTVDENDIASKQNSVAPTLCRV